MNCIFKSLLFLADFMFVAIGLMLLGIGLTVKTTYGNYDAFMASHYYSPANVAIGVGVIMFFVALFGCFATSKGSMRMIKWFCFYSGLCLILEVSVVIAAWEMRDRIDGTLRTNMGRSIVDYKRDSYHTEAWDLMQSSAFCCGIDGLSDWNSYFTTTVAAISDTTSPSSSGTNETLWWGPSSCCQPREMRGGHCIRQDVFSKGCLDALSDIVSDNALLLGCITIVAAILQLLGTIFAWIISEEFNVPKSQVRPPPPDECQKTNMTNRQVILDKIKKGNKKVNSALTKYLSNVVV